MDSQLIGLLVGGLQVKNEKTGEFETIEPVRDAFVINLGNIIGKSFALITFETRCVFSNHVRVLITTLGSPLDQRQLPRRRAPGSAAHRQVPLQRRVLYGRLAGSGHRVSTTGPQGRRVSQVRDVHGGAAGDELQEGDLRHPHAGRHGIRDRGGVRQG